MITVELANPAIQSFNHCECPNCLKSDDVFTTVLSGDLSAEIIEMGDDVLYCNKCCTLFDWVTLSILGTIEDEEINVLPYDDGYYRR